jgi:hypothetical protein
MNGGESASNMPGADPPFAPANSTPVSALSPLGWQTQPASPGFRQDQCSSIIIFMIYIYNHYNSLTVVPDLAPPLPL